MINVFGYGSLINHESLSSTLGRKVKCSPAILLNYYRTWTASVPVKVGDDIQQALFLDLTASSGVFCNGIVFKVYDHELPYLDCREQGYERQHVDVFISENKSSQAVTYKVADNNKSSVGCIPTKYKNTIEQGLSHYNKTFKQIFLATTESYDDCYMKGKYSFDQL